MTGARYRPGEWVAVVGARAAVLLESEPSSCTVEELWVLLREGGDHLKVLEALVKDGVTSAPPFALVGWHGTAQSVFVRGKACARWAKGDDARGISGSSVATWAEARWEAESSELQLCSDTAGAASPLLPLEAGVVRADELLFSFGEVTAAPPYASLEGKSNDALETVASVSNTLAYRVEGPGEVPAADDDAYDQPGIVQHEGYDHLFGVTIDRSVEEAAVREVEAAEPGPQMPVAKPERPRDHTEPPDRPLPRYGGAPVPTQSPGGGLIEQVPWMAPDTAVPRDRDAGAEGSRTESTHTAVARNTPESRANVAPPPTEGEDDDGATVSREVLDRLRAATHSAGPTVQAVRCRNGHANPVHLTSCRVCRADVEDQVPVTVPRPVLGVLRMSTGDLVTLDRGVLIGRGPKGDRLVAGERPHLVKVPSPDKDISRSHVEICLDGWHVLVTDLNSTNGTTVTLPGRPTERLRPGEAAQIEPGTHVSLADEVTFTFEAEL